MDLLLVFPGPETVFVAVDIDCQETILAAEGSKAGLCGFAGIQETGIEFVLGLECDPLDVMMISNQLLPVNAGFSVSDYRDRAPQLCPSWPVTLL